jgi:hypothetical protein
VGSSGLWHRCGLASLVARRRFGLLGLSLVCAIGAASAVPGVTAAGERTNRLSNTRSDAVRVDDPPAVYVNTMALNPSGAGNYGIQVGNQFIAPRSPHEWLQVAVFDRSTLAYLPDKSGNFDCEQVHAHPRANDQTYAALCVREVIKLFHTIARGHEGRYIVIAVSPRPTGNGSTDPPVGVADALIDIGAVGPAYRGDRRIPLKSGTFSAIGVLDLAHNHQGQAVQNAGGDLGQQEPGDGAITGYFLRNNANDYEFEASDRVAFDTQAGDPAEFTNAIQVGRQRFLARWSTVDVIQIVVLNRRTLKLVADENVDISGEILRTIASLREMERVLTAANDAGDDLVFVNTVHWPTLDRGTRDLVDAPNILDRIARQIERLGGTRTNFFDMFDPSLNRYHYSYTLVGSSDLGAGRGLETLGKNPDDRPGPARLNSAPVQGTLVRDNQWNYEVADSEAAGIPEDVGTHVVNAVLQAPSQWPDHGDPGRTAAIAWVGEHVGLLGPNPRARYYTIPYKYATWQGISEEINDPSQVPFEVGHGFSEEDLAWARGELTQEIKWLEAVHERMEVLAEPFKHAGLAQWASLQEIARKVKDLVVPADRSVPDQTVRFLTALGNVIIGVGGLFPTPIEVTKEGLALAVDAGTIGHTIYSEYSAFADLIALGTGENAKTAADSFEAKTDAVGTELAKRLDAIQAFLTNQVPNIIAADYDKLKLVGGCFLGNATECPNPLSQWEITNAGLNEAAKAVKAAAEINFWGVLLGSKYIAYQLPWSRFTEPGKHFVSGTFFDLRCPFAGETGSLGILARPIHRDITQGAESTHNVWEIWALGHITGAGTLSDPYLMNYPRADLPARVFGEPSPSGNIDEGGLGVYREAFFRQYFQIKDFGRYPLRDSPLGRWDISNNVECTD